MGHFKSLITLEIRSAKAVNADDESLVSSTANRKGLVQEYRDLEDKVYMHFN